MSSTAVQTAPLAPEKMSTWFSDMIALLQSDHFNLKNDWAPEDTRQIYTTVINGGDEMYSQMRNMSSAHFITKLLISYLDELKAREVKLKELAFDYSRSKILVWAEVADDDEATMEQLIIAEAIANGAVYNTDFNISTTLVEERDRIGVPPHYHTLNPFRN